MSAEYFDIPAWILDPQRPLPLDVWVHRDGWAGRTRTAGVLVKRNPKRSRVVIGGREVLVPNYALTERQP